MISKFRECPKCHKKAVLSLLNHCTECGYTFSLDPFIMEKIKPLDTGGFFPTVPWNEKSGQTEFEYGYDFEYKDWFTDEKLKYFTGE